MNKYEYILLEDFDKDSSAEEILKYLEGEIWTNFESNSSYLSFVAEHILEENHYKWEVYDEDDGVCLAVKEAGNETFEVYWVHPWYKFTADSDFMFDKDDFKSIEESFV
ncbi:hypothetical protein BKG95_10310 [Rodentibacter pneumotropicus]|uniref:Uncharacterized protein n=1 Tax=Rodentibacter pneumotropicus TaxID=758 RepID=A0AAW5LD05_9PAST|nr:hypothetical protein [Rodentibacter pneumotropicus]MCQ9121281.1 hypothetical protein [Rodentibacter pneumotropicus]OOF66592.1 hypothetical protein BKG95_10310 [Rodentibacter pneumotropicus]